MATIAPGQTNLRVMPTAALPDAQLFTQIPSATAGLQLFEQAAKLPLLMEQIKMEKVRQKSEKAKLDLAEMQANYQMQNFDKLAQQQQALADAQLGLAQAQAAAAQDPVALQRRKAAQQLGVDVTMFSNTPEGTAALDRDIAANAAISDFIGKGGNIRQWQAMGNPLPETGIFSARGAGEAAPEPTAPTAAPAAAAAQVPTAATTPEYFSPNIPTVTVPQGMKPIDRAIAISQETGKTVQDALKELSVKEETIPYVNPVDGTKWTAYVTRDNQGNVYNRYAVQTDAGPKDPAVVKTRLASLDRVRGQVAAIKEKLKKGEFDDGFGVLDATSVGWLMDPNKPVPVRFAAGLVANDKAKALARELSVTAKSMQELAGSALSAGEAKRYDPYVPGPTDLVLGKDDLLGKLDLFELRMTEEEDSLLQMFPSSAKGVPAGKGKTTSPAPTGNLDDAISAYLNAP